ncbi:MAG: hypothetical protein HUK12_03855 [Muribaculaceae bacterium]|nr:hypothetical protein [Muribaculaceae bacterium]
MSIKMIKQFSCKKNGAKQVESVVAKIKARRAARKAAEALVAAKKARKHEGDGEEAADINLDADTATVMFTDKEANIQVVVGEDPENGGITVAVATAENDNLEDEEVLASVTVGEEPDVDDPEEAKKKCAAVEAARNAIKARLRR